MSERNNNSLTSVTMTGSAVRSTVASTLTATHIRGEDMANGDFLSFLDAIRGLFLGLGSSSSTDNVPLVGETQATSFPSDRRTPREKKDHIKGKIGDMTLEVDGHDAPEMFRDGSNTLIYAHARRKGIDFTVGTLEKLRDKELAVKEKNEKSGADGDRNPGIDGQPLEPQKPTVKTIRMQWSKWFHKKFPFPNLPPILAPFLKNCPDGCKDSVLFHLISMVGTLSLPMVRSMYIDGKIHAPTMQLITVGDAGIGKSIIGQLFRRLYGRVIIADEEKVNAINAKPKDPDTPPVRQILQVVGYNMTEPVLYQILNNNDGVPAYIFEPEISTILEARKKGNGPTAEMLRKAHDGDTTTRLTRARSAGGAAVCTLRFSLAVTGTPDDAEKFKNSPLGSMQGGNASRIIWCEFEEQVEKPSMVIPDEDKLSDIRTELLELRTKFCYTTNDCDEDIPCNEYHIDLSYVSDALANWIEEQKRIAEDTEDYCRKGFARRMASIAFNCAITLHMLYGEPTSANRTARKSVIEGALYIANFCLERYIKLFGAEENKVRKAHLESEMVTVVVPDGEDDEETGTEEMSEEELAAKIIEEYQHNVNGHGWDSVADKLGLPVDRVRYLHWKYTKKNGDGSSGV